LQNSNNPSTMAHHSITLVYPEIRSLFFFFCRLFLYVVLKQTMFDILHEYKRAPRVNHKRIDHRKFSPRGLVDLIRNMHQVHHDNLVQVKIIIIIWRFSVEARVFKLRGDIKIIRYNPPHL
jgi:hypothetical protein